MTYMDRRRSMAALSKDRLYKVGDAVPTIVADFKRNKYLLSGEFVSFDDMFTHTRSSSATYNDANGNFVTAGSNVPRVGHHIWDGNRYVNRGLLMEGQRVNKCLNYNANPTDLTGVIKAGDAATLTVVDDSAALSAAGLSDICTSGKVYKLDNSAGVGAAYGIVNGATGDTSQHTISTYARLEAGAARLEFGVVGSLYPTNFSGDAYTRYSNSVPLSFNAGSKIQIRAEAGAVVYFILNQLEEGDAATSPIVVEGSAATRAPDLLTMTNLSGLDNGFWVVLPKFALNGVDGAYDRVIQFDDGLNANRNTLFYSAGNQTVGVNQFSGAVNQGSRSRTYTLGDTTKVAARFGPNKFAVVWEDGTIYEDTGCAYTSPDRMCLAASNASGSDKPASMSLAGIMLHPPSITPAQMAAHLGGLS